MPLSPELADLKARLQQAIQWKASIARVDHYLEAVEAGPVPAGMSPEQHLLQTLDAIADGSHKPGKKAPEPKAKAKVKAPEPAKAPKEEPKAPEPPPAPKEEPKAPEPPPAPEPAKP